MVFPTFFNFSLNLAKGVHDLRHSHLLVLFLLSIWGFCIFGCKEYTQSDFGVFRSDFTPYNRLQFYLSHQNLFKCIIFKWLSNTPLCIWRHYTWTSPDGQHWNQIDCILCSQRWRSSIQSAKTRPGPDCGSDDELLIAKFRLKLKKVGKTTRPFRYDLNQVPYDYTVEMRHRFKGLDMIDRVPDDGDSWHCTGGRNQDHPHGKEIQKSKMAVWGGLTNSSEKKRSEEKRKDISIWMQSSKE